MRLRYLCQGQTFRKTRAQSFQPKVAEQAQISGLSLTKYYFTYYSFFYKKGKYIEIEKANIFIYGEYHTGAYQHLFPCNGSRQ